MYLYVCVFSHYNDCYWFSFWLLDAHMDFLQGLLSLRWIIPVLQQPPLQPEPSGNSKSLKCTSNRKQHMFWNGIFFFPSFFFFFCWVHVLHYPHRPLWFWSVSGGLVGWTSAAAASQRLWGCRHSKSRFDGNPICSQLTKTAHSRVDAGLARWCFDSFLTLWIQFWERKINMFNRMLL